MRPSIPQLKDGNGQGGAMNAITKFFKGKADFKWLFISPSV